VLRSRHGKLWLQKLFESLGRNCPDTTNGASKRGLTSCVSWFTPDGILRLERKGRERRNRGSRGLPNLTKLAQLLRVVGERLDDLSGRLVKVSKRGDNILIEYASATNRRGTEEWKLAELYDLWLEACKRREGRTDVIERELLSGTK